MNCENVRPLLSTYLDGVVSGAEMQLIERHLEGCGECNRQFTGLRAAQAMLASLGRRPAPPDLSLRLRVALSQQRSMTFSRRVQRGFAQLEQAINSFVMPATAGLVSAVLIFALLLGVLIPAQLAAAASNDVPSGLYLPPKLVASGVYGTTGGVTADAPVLVETYVDAMGRVQDYRIIDGEDSDEIRTELNRMLIFTVFEPAKAFGRPVPGRVVLSFSNVNVRG